MIFALIMIFFLVVIISYCNKKASIHADETVKADKELSIVYAMANQVMRDVNSQNSMDEMEAETMIEPNNDQDEYVSDGVVYAEDFEVRSAAYHYFKEQMPELDIIEEYITKKTSGKAEIYINTNDICEVYDENDNSKLLGRYYPIYVGERWEDGRKIPWDFFYVREDAADILHQDVALLDMESIEEWRSSEIYKDQMEGMVSYLEKYTMERGAVYGSIY